MGEIDAQICGCSVQRFGFQMRSHAPGDVERAEIAQLGRFDSIGQGGALHHASVEPGTVCEHQHAIELGMELRRHTGKFRRLAHMICRNAMHSGEGAVG